MMSDAKFTPLGGQMEYTKLTSALPEEEYAKFKAHIWLHLLNKNMRPKKWLKATKKGTKVNFDFIQSQEEYDAGLVDLEVFLSEINIRFKLDFNLRQTKGEEQ